MNQSYRNLEILVIDDGSTDGAVEAVRASCNDRRIRWFRQENAGKPVALNWALKELRGDFYVIQDADDLSYSHRIERLVEAMKAHPSVAAVLSGHDVLIGKRRCAPRFRPKTAYQCRADIERLRMPAHDPTAMYRVNLVRHLEYDPTLRIGQGYDYLLRVGERSPLIVLGECLYSYRLNWDSVTRSDTARRREYVWAVLRQASERRGLKFRSLAEEGSDWDTAAQERDNNLAAHFIESALDLRSAGRRAGAIKVGIQCARLHPLNLHYHKALVYAVSPMWLVRRVRRAGDI